MLRAYFDASATQGDNGIYAVGGFVGHEEDWSELEAKWREGLRTFELTEFHLADIIPTLGQHMGELCIMHFSRIVGKSNVEGIGASCDKAYWRSAGTGYQNPYHFCFSLALHVLNEHVSLEFPETSVEVVIDDDINPPTLAEDIFAAYARENARQFASLTVGNRRKFVPIQCADLAAGALRKEWLAGFLSDNRKLLREFQGALGHKSRFAHFSREMVEMAQRAKAAFKAPS